MAATRTTGHRANRTSVKIFGERNTGTNALRRLVEQNSEARVLPSIWPELDETFPETSKGFTARLLAADSPQSYYRIVREREDYIDAIYAAVPRRFAWKHALTDFERVDDFRDCLVVMSVRHPASWLLGLYAKPHHLLQPLPPSFEAFLGSSWHTLRRDGLGGRTVTPIGLYNAKLAALSRFAGRLAAGGIDHEIVPHDRLVTDQLGVVRGILAHLAGPAARPTSLTASTSDPNKSLDDYRAYYGREAWRADLSAEAVGIIADGVDWACVEVFGFQPM